MGWERLSAISYWLAGKAIPSCLERRETRMGQHGIRERFGGDRVFRLRFASLKMTSVKGMADSVSDPTLIAPKTWER
jgi:hypothetical protein